MKKRLLSILLTVCMALTLLPTAALATEGATGAPAEQFNLPIGSTYYFDLSGEIGNIGTVNTGKDGSWGHPGVPDPTLHYVPFTYAGTVNAYSLTSGQASTAATASDRSLFVADYNVSHTNKWTDLHTANLIFGKTFDTNYKLRSLSAGSNHAEYKSGTPITNEWDSISGKNGLINPIKNWKNIASWGQDTKQSNSIYRALRGKNSAAYWNDAYCADVYPAVGWRPALEVLNPTALKSDGLKAVTLNLNGGSFDSNGSVADGVVTSLNIVCAGASFTAPSGEVITPPSGKLFDKWNTQKEGNGTSYDVGDSVLNSVATLYAQWTEPPAAPNVTFSFDDLTNAGKLMGATTLMEYSLDGSTWAACTAADMALTQAQIDVVSDTHDIQVRVKATVSTPAGTSLTIDITKAGTPTNLTTENATGGASNGKIKGTTDKMEYSADSAFTNPIACTGTETTGLAAGDYYIRVKATGHVLASDATKVSVGMIDVTVPSAGSKVYTGSTQTSDLVTTNEYTVTTNAGGTDVGSYGVVLTLKDSTTHQWAGGSTTDQTIKFEITKASQAAPVAATASSTGVTSITLTEQTGKGKTQYSCNTSNTAASWQDSNVFNSLTSNTKYYFFVKFDGDANHNEAVTTTGAEISTRSGGDYFPTMVTEIKSGESITAENLDWLIFNKKNLTVTGADGAKLVFGTDALRGINDQTSGSVKVEIKDVSKEHQDTHGGKNVFSLTVTSGGKTVSGFAGKVTISLPYTLKDGENAEDVTVWSLAEDGSMTKIPATYDPKTGLATATANYFSEYVVGVWVNPFTDVDSGAYYYDALLWAVGKNITGGTSATTFDPDLPCTRAQAVSFLWRVAGSPAATGNNPFTDVDSGAYYYDAVLWAVGKGITKGTSATTFAPNTICNRGHIAAFLYRYAGSPTVLTGNPFTDVAADAYYYDAVLWAVEKGITSGTSATTFAPNTTCTRGQIVTFLYRHMGK